ncbi:hypothetical protein HDU79_011361 [Rhizoclosmatium sp. JEL0117]|nr:hypothetical protein HDU79_011361 [Rhizoclosmatium sp. JEL0117]
MSFQQFTIFPGNTCAVGSATFGVTASVPALTNNKSSCSSLVGSGIACKSVGTFSETVACSNGAQDLLKLMSGPVFTINIYSDTACGSPVETAAAVLDKCISISAGGTSFNAIFTTSKNGTVDSTLYDDSACKVASKDQSTATPATLPQCEGQVAPALGQCAKIPTECVAAFSSRYNGVSLGSFKYEQVVAVPATKSSALGVGISFVAGAAALLLI